MNINDERHVLKDSTNNDQPKQKIFLKYKESINNLEFKTNVKSNIGTDKENINLVVEKKVKLKLKTFSSKELTSKQTELLTLKKNKEQKINQLNSVPKPSKNHKENFNNLKEKSNKINTYFKPSVIYFSLKTNKENEILASENQSRPSETIQEVKVKKNYQLAAFISEFVHKLKHSFFDNSNREENEENENSFFYSEFVEILHSLLLIRNSSENQYKVDIEDHKEELQKVYLLWRIFKTNTFATPAYEIRNRNYFYLNLIILLSTILRVNIENIQELNEIFIEKFTNEIEKRTECQKEDQNQLRYKDPSHIFFIKNKKLLNPQPKIIFEEMSFIDLSEPIKNDIFKEFELFRINRLNSQNCPKTFKEEVTKENEQFEFNIGSLISPKSKELAQTKRMKILEEIRKNELENNDTFKENDLNLFLSYKSPKSCETKIIRNSEEVFPQNKKEQTFQSKEKTNKKEIIEIKSPKIKYSELNVVQNMEKARKLKQEKQLILEKGWTNSGQNSLKSSKEKEINPQKTFENKKNYNSLNECLSNKVLTNSGSLNFFEKRKMSFRGMKILEEKMKKKGEIIENKEEFKDYEDLFLGDENENEEVRREIELLDDISNSTIPLKDNECFDLEDGDFNEDQDFILESPFEFEKDMKSKELQPIKSEENTRTETQNLEKINKDEIEDFNFKSKTFNTEENEFLEDDSSNSQIKTERSSKEARIIKSYLKIPILYVDVNMDDSKKERIIIYEGDNPEDLAKEFGHKHKLGIQMIERLEEMLKEQIGGILGRIDEEDDENDETHEEIPHP